MHESTECKQYCTCKKLHRVLTFIYTIHNSVKLNGGNGNDRHSGNRLADKG